VVPAERAGTETGGASSETCASQRSVVPGTASLMLAGHVGTTKAAVVASDVGVISAEAPAM
jgi:hypothetical protein